MASQSNYAFRISSFNMHGFNNGYSMVKELCGNFDIILLQEHWLLSNHLHKLSEIDCNFQIFAVSAMDNKCATSILTGRPYGGVAVLFRKCFSEHIQLLSCDLNEGRFISFKLKCIDRSIVITNVYFPYSCAHNDYALKVS